MKSGKGKIFGIIAIIILIGLGVAVYQKATTNKSEAAQPKKMPLVAVIPVQLGSVTRNIESSGTVEPENVVNIVPKVEQRIIWMPFKEGDIVARGQVLARLDNAEASDQLASTRAEVAVTNARLRDVLAGARPQEIRGAKAILAQAQSNAQQAKKDLEHIKQLYGASGIPQQQLDEAQSKYDTAEANVESAKATLKDAETELGRQKKMLKIGGVSQEDVDKAQTRYDVSKSVLNSANSALRSAKSNLSHVQELNVKVIPEQKLDEAKSKYASALSAVESAKARLDLLNEGASSTQIAMAREQVKQAALKVETLRTQADYTVIKSPVNGTITRMYMSEGDLAQTKQPLMSISESGRMVVKVAVTDIEAAALRPGNPAILQKSTGAQIKLKVTNIYPSADPATRLIPIELALPKNANMSQGSFARVNIILEKRDNCVLVPTDAVQQKPGGKSVVFTVEGDKAVAKPIVTGIESNSKVEVISGLNAGEILVVKGQEMLKDGVKVKVKPMKGTMGQNKQDQNLKGNSKSKSGGMSQ